MRAWLSIASDGERAASWPATLPLPLVAPVPTPVLSPMMSSRARACAGSLDKGLGVPRQAARCLDALRHAATEDDEGEDTLR